MGTTYVQYPQSGGGGNTGSQTGVPYVVGPLDGAPANAQGGTIGSFSFYQQSATATFPGLINSASQILSGVKTFSNGIVSSVTGLASLNLPLTGGTITGSISMSSNKISNLLDPTTAQEAATKNYVDTSLSAFQPLDAVVAASIVNYPGLLVGNILTVTATGSISVDGVTPNANDRILIKDQTTQAQNGVYTVTTVGSVGVSPVLTRATDYNTAAEVNSGASIPVIGGSVNKFTTWIQTATVVTINTDSLVFTQFAANPQNVPISVGAINSATASLNGAVIGSSTLYLQAASAANPGLVSSASQTFAGVKTFNSAPNLNSLSPSAQLALDGSRNIIVASVSLTTNVTGVLPNANMSAVALGTAAQVTGSLSLTAQVVGVLPNANMSAVNLSTAAQVIGSLSLTGQAVGVLPVINGGSNFADTRESIGSITFSQAPGGNTYPLSWPISVGSTSWLLQSTNGLGSLSWVSGLTNPMSASGDMIVGSGAGVAARLGIGPAGSVLMSDTTASNSVSWQSPSTLTNSLVNSGFDYWQAAGSGSTVVSTGIISYSSDQWWLDNRTTATSTSVTITQQTPLLPTSGSALKAAITGAQSVGSGSHYIGQMLSIISSRPFYGQRASASVQVLAFNNIVSAVNIAALTNTVEAVGTYSVIASATFSITSASYTSVSLNNFLVGTAHGLSGVVGFRVGPQTISSGTVNTTANIFQIEQGVMNVGPVASPFSRQYSDPAAELNSCLYFFEKIGGNFPGEPLGLATFITTTAAAVYLPFQVQKRTTCTVTFATAANFQIKNSVNNYAASSIANDLVGFTGIKGTTINATIGSAQTVNTSARANCSGTGFIYCDARMG